jgi:microcin C transport system ATP-binding protein
LTAPLLSVRDLSVAFTQGGKETLAVDHISFDIAKGETVALVGESGSGKSVSALSVIMRLLAYPAARHPTGEIYFDGKDLLKVPDAVMRTIRGGRISIIFQEPMTSLNPLHTIEQQVGEILRFCTWGSTRPLRARTLELLRKVGIRDAGEASRRLSASAVGWPAPARDDRHGARQRARTADRRRADDGARRHHPGADPDAAQAGLQRELGMAMLLITHDLGIVRRWPTASMS